MFRTSRSSLTLVGLGLAIVAAGPACGAPAPFVSPVVTVVAPERQTPTLTPGATDTPIPIQAAFRTTLPTMTQTHAPLPTLAPTATVPPLVAPSPEPTVTPSPTLAPTATATREPTQTAVPSPTETLAPPVTATPTSAPTATATAVPSEVPPEAVVGRIAFVTGDGRLWTMNPDGTSMRNVASNVYLDGSLAWSPDGIMLAYQESKIVGSAPRLAWRIVELEEKMAPRFLARIETTGDLSWSPDSDRVLYSLPFDGIYSLDLRSKKSKKILESAADTVDKSPLLSPRGNRLLFVHFERGVDYYIGMVKPFSEDDETYQYGRSFIAGTDRDIALLDSGATLRSGQSFRFQWRQDDKSFVYGAESIGDATGRVLLYDGRVKELTDDVIAPVEENTDLSNRGDRIVYASPEGIAVVDVAGSRELLISSESKHARPRWSPDDRFIAFLAEGRIFLVQADGSGLVEVPGAEGVVSFEWSNGS